MTISRAVHEQVRRTPASSEIRVDHR